MNNPKLPIWILYKFDSKLRSKRNLSFLSTLSISSVKLLILLFLLINVEGSIHQDNVALKFSSNTEVASLITPAFLFQVEMTTPVLSDTQVVSSGVKCMQAQKSVRTISNFSFLLTLVVSFLFYTLWLFLAPRLGPPMVKWAISPLLASLLIAVITAYYAQIQNVESCGLPQVFPVDIFAKNFLFDWAICGGIFLVWCLIRFFSLRKRIGSSLA